MPEHAPDPGGTFASDVHRRLLAVVPNPDEEAKAITRLVERLDRDPYVPLGSPPVEAAGDTAFRVTGDVEDLLKELVDDGFVSEDNGRYKMTDGGREALSAPPPEAPPGTPVRPAMLGSQG